MESEIVNEIEFLIEKYSYFSGIRQKQLGTDKL